MEEMMRTDQTIVALTSTQVGNGYVLFAALSDGTVYSFTADRQQWAPLPPIPGTVAEVRRDR